MNMNCYTDPNKKFQHYASSFESQKQVNSGIHTWTLDYTQQYPSEQATELMNQHDTNPPSEHDTATQYQDVPSKSEEKKSLPSAVCCEYSNSSDAYTNMKHIQNLQNHRDNALATMKDINAEKYKYAIDLSKKMCDPMEGVRCGSVKPHDNVATFPEYSNSMNLPSMNEMKHINKSPNSNNKSPNEVGENISGGNNDNKLGGVYNFTRHMLPYDIFGTLGGGAGIQLDQQFNKYNHLKKMSPHDYNQLYGRPDDTPIIPEQNNKLQDAIGDIFDQTSYNQNKFAENGHQVSMNLYPGHKQCQLQNEKYHCIMSEQSSLQPANGGPQIQSNYSNYDNYGKM